MKNLKRIISLCLSLVVASGVFLVSCNKKDDLPSGDSQYDSTTEADTDAQKEATPIYISNKGTLNFSITIPENIDTDVKEKVEALYSSLNKRTGGAIPTINEANINTYDANACEILIGDIGYPETNEAMNSIGYGEWTVRFVGNKLVVTGFSNLAVGAAVTSLVKTIKEVATDDGTIMFMSDTVVSKVQDEIVNRLPKIECEKQPQTADEAQNTSLLVVSDMTVDKYSEYLNKITNSGYTLYTSNMIGKNKFSTYDNGEYVIHAGFYDYESAMRVTIEKKTTLVPLENENTWEPNSSVVTSVAQVGLGEEINVGMSYCYQLADGSFIVIDGGFFDDATQLYEYMRAKAPGKDIVIASWFISHNDGDHKQAFVQFVASYKENVIIEQVVANLPVEAEAQDTTVLAAAKSLEGCRLIKAHTGQKFYIRNAVIEMLYTMDSYLPRPLTIFNNSSIVFTVDVEGERALFLGDASDEVAEILSDMYGDYLKSDILQLAHHGVRNSHGLSMPETIILYSLVRPEVVFWPSSNEHYLNSSLSKDLQIAAFNWNLEALKSARECFMAGDGVTVLELPYSIYSAYKFVLGETRDPVCRDSSSTISNLKYNEFGIVDSVSWND